MRRIVTQQEQALGGGAGEGIDGFFDRILKYIPADVVGAWIAVTGLIAGEQGVPKAQREGSTHAIERFGLGRRHA